MIDYDAPIEKDGFSGLRSYLDYSHGYLVEEGHVKSVVDSLASDRNSSFSKASKIVQEYIRDLYSGISDDDWEAKYRTDILHRSKLDRDKYEALPSNKAKNKMMSRHNERSEAKLARNFGVREELRDVLAEIAYRATERRGQLGVVDEVTGDPVSRYRVVESNSELWPMPSIEEYLEER